jgi:hypothetical protein
MAMASFPLTKIFSVFWLSTFPPDSNGYIRADLSADRASSAGFMITPAGEEISLTIDLISDPNQFLGAGNGTEPTPLTSLTINFNLCHHELPVGIVE